MQTFCSEKPLEYNPGFNAKKVRSLKEMSDVDIETPVVEVVNSLNKLPFCFTLQSCFGHFLIEGENISDSFYFPYSYTDAKEFLYRISYVAICVDSVPESRRLLTLLRDILNKINTEYLQFGCAEWYWEQYVNSYVIQVQPWNRSNVDSLYVTTEEAQKIRTVRDHFWKIMAATLQGTTTRIRN